MTDMISFYRALLKTGWMTADADGFVSKKSSTKTGALEPALIDGKRMVIPTDVQTRSPDTENRIYFHPLCESALKGESTTLQRLRRAYACSLNYSMAMTLSALLEMAASHADHAKLDPEQSVILSPLKDTTADTVLQFLKIVEQATVENGPESSLVKVYLKNRATVGGTTYARGCIVTFPVYQELLKDEEKVFGVKLSKKERATLVALFEHTMPGIREGLYDIGSNSDVAPFLDSLLRAVAKIGSNLNYYITMYKLDDADDSLAIPLDWYDASKTLETFLPEIRRTPAIGVDVGSSKVIDDLQKTTSVTSQQGGLLPPAFQSAFGAAPGNMGLAPQVQAPATDLAEIMRRREQNVHQPAPVQQVYVAPQMSGPPLVTERGLNFAVLLNRQNNQQGVNQYNQPQNQWGQPQSGFQQPQMPQNNWSSGV